LHSRASNIEISSKIVAPSGYQPLGASLDIAIMPKGDIQYRFSHISIVSFFCQDCNYQIISVWS
jgi:hypothetical protein